MSGSTIALFSSPYPGEEGWACSQWGLSDRALSQKKKTELNRNRLPEFRDCGWGFQLQVILRCKQVVSWRLGSSSVMPQRCCRLANHSAEPGVFLGDSGQAPRLDSFLFSFLRRRSLEERETWIQRLKWGYWMRWSLKTVPAFCKALSLWAWLKEERF